jgi:hypothetical protein
MLKSKTKVMIPRRGQRYVALPSTKTEMMISLRLVGHSGNLAAPKARWRKMTAESCQTDDISE